MVAGAVALGLLVVVVLLIYLMGRLGQMEQQIRDALSRAQNLPGPVPTGPFGGLSGKTLWDAMIGKPLPQVSSDQIEIARESYPAVLHKHIVQTFEEGVADGKKGITGNPKNPRTVHTLRGKVDSWLPTGPLQTIYQCGSDLAQGKPADDASLQQSLEVACQELHDRAGVMSDTDYVQILLTPSPNAPSTASLGSVES